MISLRCGKSQANPYVDRFLYCLPGNFRYYVQIVSELFNAFNSTAADLTEKVACDLPLYSFNMVFR